MLGYKAPLGSRTRGLIERQKKARRKIRCTSNSFCFDSHSNFFPKFCIQTPHRLCLTTCGVLYRLSAALIELISQPQRPMEGQQKNLFGLPDFSDTPREKKKLWTQRWLLGGRSLLKLALPPFFLFWPPYLHLLSLHSHLWSSSLSTNLGLVFHSP